MSRIISFFCRTLIREIVERLSLREKAPFIKLTWLVIVVELDHSRLLANNKVLLH